jgi:hypothetical protein
MTTTLEINKTQDYYKNLCIENAKKYCGEHYEVKVSHESVYEWNGTYSFILNIDTKEEYRNSLLILFDKSWLVTITKRGVVHSKKIHSYQDSGDKNFKRNKSCIFI